MYIKCVFENNIGTTYNATAGSVFKDVINETLSSGVIRLDNISQGDRLFNLNCYNYVCAFDDTETFRKYYLIDNFVENETNLIDHTFSYTINLMSEAKITEKIQLPNLKITNSLVATPLTIADYINRYCSLYVKKVKFTTNGTTWSYNYLFDFSAVVSDTRFTVPCPEMSWNAPTLRQVLTDLMGVVGCIPKVENRVLTYIDLKATPTPFIMTKVNYVTRSMASDSYVTSLVTQGDNIVDTNNLVINETIGFRDRENVFLKQTENLKLNTKQKIFNIYSCKLNLYLSPYLMEFTNHGTNAGNTFKMYATKKGATSGYVAKIMIPDTITDLTCHNVVIKVLKYDTSATAQVVDTINLGTVGVTTHEAGMYTYTYTNISNNFTAVSIECTYLGTFYYFNQYISQNTDENDLVNEMYLVTRYVSFVGLYRKDITPLIVEQGKRQGLDTDFLNMSSATTISQLAQYYYGTVGYAIGGTEISGFSQTYTVSNGFWDSTKTYIENILNVLLQNDKYGEIDTHTLVSTNMAIPYSQTYIDGTGVSIYTPSNISQFANIFFDISYRPMNSLTIKYAKENIDMPYEIEQLDTQEASIPALDTMSEREIEKANRLGNDLYQIHASFIDNMAGLNDLNTYIDFTHGNATDRAIVFSREISIYGDFIEVNYLATKDYILKEYFTSIQTKYRAYEYVSYDKAVERKENIKIYALIDKFFVNGDDRLWCGETFNSNARNEKSLFLSGAIRKTDTLDNLIRYAFESDILYTDRYKNEVSMPNFKNTMCFAFKDYDNVSAGNYIVNTTESALGGLPQGWYLWDNDSQIRRVVGFFSGANIISDYPVFTDLNDASANLFKIYNDPRINSSYTPTYNDYVNLFVVDSNIAGIGSDNLLANRLTLYKDQGELLNFNLQIEFYTTSNDIKWTSRFISQCELSDRNVNNKNNAVIATNTLDVKEEMGDTSSIGMIHTNVSDYVELVTTNKDIPYLNVKWGSIPSYIDYIRVINLVNNGDNYYDVMSFYRNLATTDTYYYISFNDTKTLKVYSRDSDSNLWSLSHYAETDTNERLCSEAPTDGFKTSLVSFSVSEESLVDFNINLVYFTTETESV